MSERANFNENAPESGREYLKRIEQEYLAYKNFLPGLSDQAFNYQRHLHRDLDVGGFLADFALAAEEDRRKIVRWQIGEKLPRATDERVSAIQSVLPKFTVLNKEAIGGMSIEKARRYKIDIVAEDIMNEIAKRLPKTLDAYRYHQEYAQDELEVNGLGKIKVDLTETGEGIFSTIFTVSGPNFRIHNFRDSGVKYLDRYLDMSRPSNIEIKPENIKINIYSDGSGMDQRDPDKLEKLQEEAIVWLVDNVLNPIRKMPIPDNQLDIPPMDEPFPEGRVGPLYAFVKTDDLKKIEILKHGTERAYPDERSAVHPSWRLIPLGYSTRGLPEEVHDGFIWCGIGDIDKDADMENLTIADRQMDAWSMFGGEGLAEIKPLTATDVYVVDWGKWDEYREKTFTETHDRLTRDEVEKMYQEVGRTLIPITEYKQDYKKPVVLIGRNLEVSEIGNVFLPARER